MVNPKAIPLKHTLFAAVLLIASVPIAYSFTMGVFTSSIIWPTIGFAYAFLFIKGKDIAPVVFLSIFAGYVISHISLGELMNLSTLVTSFMLATSGFLAAALGAYLTRKFNIMLNLDFRNIGLMILVTIILTATAALLGNLTFMIQSMLSYKSFVSSYITWFLGDFYGMIIFGLPLVISLQLDKDPFFGDFTWKEALFFAILILFSTLLFTDYIPYLSFVFHKYLYIPFAVIIALYFPIRTLYLFSLVILMMMAIITPFLVEPDIFIYMSEVNILLVMLTLIAIIVKIVYLDLETQKASHKKRQTRLEALVDSMQEMFSLSNQASRLHESNVEREASKIFRMAFKMFDEIDYGSCAFIRGDKVHFVDMIGYDIDTFNSLPLSGNDWVKNLDKPQIFTHTNRLFINQLGDEIYDIVQDTNPFDIKESLFMSIQLTESIHCELSFDIKKESPHSFKGTLYEYFEGLNVMLNTFFEANRKSIGLADQKNSMVVSLLKAIDLFDKYTRIHSEHVADIAREIARKAGLSEEQVSELYWAGIVHDIGKIGIDITIINKPKNLTVLEYEKIKSHPERGYMLLRQSDTLKSIAQFVRHHHERYDGQGYPDGLSGDENLEQSYILGLSEAIASMFEARSYSPALDEAAIIKEIEKEKGFQFDPTLSDIAIKLIENGLVSRVKKDKT
ncbi:MAG: HD domain-containing phosphohydrolase [Bacillota bacterium]